MRSALPAAIVVILVSLFAIGQQPVTEPVKDSAALPTASGLWIAVGPGNVVLPSGTYRFVFLPADPAEQVQVTTISTAGGNVPPPPPPPPPPVEDARTKLSAAIAKITDVDKAKVAGDLKGLLEPMAKNIREGGIAPDQLRSGINAIGPIITQGKPSWAAFIACLSDCLKAATTGTACAGVLDIAVDELGKV